MRGSHWAWFSLVVFLLAAPAAAGAMQVRVVPAQPRQGDVAVVFVSGVHNAREIEGSLAGRPLAFFPYGEEYAALAGIDLERKPGRTAWRVGLVDAAGAPRKASGTVAVRSRKFAVQRLTLPKHMVDLDPDTERRADFNGVESQVIDLPVHARHGIERINTKIGTHQPNGLIFKGRDNYLTIFTTKDV